MARRVYKVHKTEARYNIHGVDTWRVVYRAEPTPLQKSVGIKESWVLASDKICYSLQEAEEELARLKKEIKNEKR